MTDVIPWIGPFASGTWVIIKLFLLGMVLMTLWGLLASVAKLSRNRVLNALGGTYTAVFRGMPSFLVVLILYFGFSYSLTWFAQLYDPTVRFVDLPPFYAGALAISLVVGAYAAETFRGAFLGVNPGVIEAAYALGMSPLRVFVYIRLPLMWRLALPAFGTHTLSLLKDTALVSTIGVQEVLFTAQMATTYSGKPFTMYFVVALIFLALATLVVATFAMIERYAYRHVGRGR